VAVLEIVVGRQPVFDRDSTVVGYELLYRQVEGDDAYADELDGDLMTTAVLFNSVGIGVSRLVGDKIMFFNADRGLLVGDVPSVLAPSQTVFEIVESVSLDDEVLEGCKRLVRAGYTLAMDHFRWFDGCEQLLKIVSLVKIDIETVVGRELTELMRRCRDFDVSLIAERVETEAQLAMCKDLGFDYFQGYLLSRPRLIPGKTLDSSSVARLELAARLAASECSAADLEEVIRAEPTMSFQVMQMAGAGADHGFRRKIQTLREAIVLVGWRQLQSWISFLILTSKGETSEEEVITVLTRARTAELLAREAFPMLAGLAFAAGMLSAFDVLLGLRLEDVLLSLPLDPDLQDAVLGKDTDVGRIVADVIDVQLGSIDSAIRSGFSAEELHKASVKGLSWALEVSRGFVRTGKGPTLRKHKPATTKR